MIEIKSNLDEIHGGMTFVQITVFFAGICSGLCYGIEKAVKEQDEYIKHKQNSGEELT